jgi:glycosyltransferase involved in cell wall biosynthesis
MIPAYNRTQYLEKTLRSVLLQDPGAEEMQIEVVDDASTVDDPEPLVRRLAGDRISFVRNPRNLGLMPNFNNCIQRSIGHWVHILHTDDFVLPGFYERLKAGLEGQEEIGAAVSRNALVDGDERSLGASELFRPTAGILTGLLERFARSNPLWCPAVVVKRSVYENLGGFRPELPLTGDWEMWIRIAAHYQVWYEPAILAVYRDHADTATAGFIASGEVDADVVRCLELSRPLLPANPAETVLQKARESLYLRSILRTSDDEATLKVIDGLMKAARRHPVHRSAVANAALRGAQIHFRRGERLLGLVFVARAIRIRPIVAGRPLKRALGTLLRAFRSPTSQGA